MAIQFSFVFIYWIDDISLHYEPQKWHFLCYQVLEYRQEGGMASQGHWCLYAEVCCVLLVSTVENADLQLNVVANDEHVKGAMFCKQGTSEAGIRFVQKVKVKVSFLQSQVLIELNQLGLQRSCSVPRADF